MPIKVESLTKAFNGTPVLRAITESFADGEISVLLGASGCGKTTTLRCIAGLERPQAGRIEINGRVVYSDNPPVFVPVERRNLSMVFQSYAIWPHMTVAQNVDLPLRAARVGRAEADKRVAEALAAVGLSDFATRGATQLSGGQQQRVALARCIVSGSPVILMDEPFSNLDANLRVAMRSEVRDLQRKLGQTVVFVTHDQEEAMSIADTIYLLNEGKVLQKGPPKEIYDNPATRYAAEFLGRANIISAFERHGSRIRIGTLETEAPPGMTAATGLLCVRPEKWRAVAPDAAEALTGRIAEIRFIGDRLEFVADTPAGRMTVVEISDEPRQIGDVVGLSVRPRDIKALA